jgi:hypothetical protein
MRMNCGYLTSSETAKLPLKEIGTSSEWVDLTAWNMFHTDQDIDTQKKPYHSDSPFSTKN